jgi:DNA-binding CsgD family transcriptional regulator
VTLQYLLYHEPMVTLTSADRERLSEILLQIYAADGVEDFRSRALAVVRRLFGGELVCHNELNLANGDSLSVLSEPLEDFQHLRPAFFEHVEDHPSVQHHLTADGGETGAVKISDFLCQRQWRNSGIYSEFYRPLADVRYQLTIGQKIDESLVFFAVSRQHRDFTEEERALLTMLRPHFIQAYRNAKCRSALEDLRARRAGNDHDGGLDGDALVFGLMHRFRLSRREAEVLVQIGKGKTNSEVAETLGISVSTVKTRLENVFRQLGVKTRTAAALRVLEPRAPEVQNQRCA